MSASVLSVAIGGGWTAHDFMQLFDAFDRMYTAVEHMQTELQAPKSARGWPAASPVAVHSIRYSSPGDVNLLGSGELLEQVREGAKDLSGRNKLDLQEQRVAVAAAEQQLTHTAKMQALEFASGAMDLISKWTEVARSAGVSEQVIADYVLEFLLQPAAVIHSLKDQGKIIEVKPVASLSEHEG